MNKILESIVASMGHYQNTYPEDACIVVADTETVIGYLPGKGIDVKVAVGTPVQSLAGTVTELALRQGKQLRDERGPERFGVAYVSTATPIVVDGEIIGVMSSVVSNQRMESLRHSASELAAVVEQMMATTEGVAESSSDVAHRVEDLAAVSNDVHSQLDNMKKILSFVHQVASQSHMLGLNAAIEATRVGEAGRGFSVIAQEIRKMAESSKRSVSTITSDLITIQNAVISMNEDIQKISGDVEENAAAVEELKATYDHIAQTAASLADLAR